MSLALQQIEYRFGRHRDALQKIFGEQRVAMTSDFEWGEEKSPYAIALHGADPQSLAELLVRLREYVYTRPLNASERAIHAQDMELLGTMTGDCDTLYLQLPPDLFTSSQALLNLEGFARMDEQIKEAVADGTQLSVLPDEAVVALSHWTGINWYITLVEDHGFKQLRVKTDRELENATEIAGLMQKSLLMANQIKAQDGYIYIPVSLLTPEKVAQMRRAGKNTRIDRLAEPPDPPAHGASIS